MTLDRLRSALSDRYRIERELGQGGMATVYLAHDLRHDRDVAIKVLREELSASLGKERFLREIQLAAKLTHPHILPLFDSGAVNVAEVGNEPTTHDPRPTTLLFYVMPYVSGQSLRERLERDKLLPVDEAVRIAVSVADALDHAHRQGIVHRDIKPENIMFQDGHALVTDFGIGKAMSDVASGTMTQAGTSLGTPAYMSPEQAVGEGIDARSDIYSLGCVLYEMLAGEPPFTGPNAQAVIAKRFVQIPADVAALRDGVSRSVAHAVQKALARSPIDRFETAAQFVIACRTPDPVASAPAVSDKSIVVLPFENMSPDKDTDYFADGISEEIINALTQCSALRVAARTSSFAFKGKHEDLRIVAEKLGVRHVLEGSVRKAGNKLRITAQLIDASNGYHLWSERYDREMDDVFAIQDEIAKVIADKMEVALRTGAAARPVAANVAAYDHYLRGMAILHRRGTGILDAIDCFKQATASDPNYGPAHAGLAQGLSLATFWGILTPEEVHQPSKDAAARALELEPDRVTSQTAAALVAINVEFDPVKAARHWDRAKAINPADIDTRANRAVFHFAYALGDIPAAIDDLRDAQIHDPLNHFLNSQLGLALTFGNRPVEAEAAARQALGMDASGYYPNWVLFLSLTLQGRQEEALALGATIVRRFGRGNWTLMGLAGVYSSLHRMEEANAIYDEMLARSRTEYVQPVILSLTAISAGKRDEGIAWFRRAAERHDAMLLPFLFCMQLPAAIAIRNEPAHAEVVRQLGWTTPPTSPSA